MPSSALRTILPGLLLLIAVVAGQAVLASPLRLLEPSGDPTLTLSPRGSNPADPDLIEFILDTFAGRHAAIPEHPVLTGMPGPVYVALRSDGVRLSDGWGTSSSRADALRIAIVHAREGLDGHSAEDVDTVELSIGGPVVVIDDPDTDDRLANVHRGVLGLEVRLGDRVTRFAPTEMIANNMSFAAARDRAMKELKSPSTQRAEIGLFPADQALIDIQRSAIAWLFRGNELVSPDRVSEESIGALADSLGDWLIRNVHPNGRMTYKYWPSRGDESSANNAIRQWMATVALGRIAESREDERLVGLGRRNIEYNLDAFFELEGELGLIVEADGDVKLGAVALAALALIEHPDRAEFSVEEAALLRTVDSLWNADGSFRTFHRPADRNDNQNFYPGEALLLWAIVLGDDPSPDSDLLDRFMASFRYYRDWHRQQPNPAFVPWHTQAYVIAWERTRNDDLRSFVFEMNDWLVELQQWDDVPYPDLRGRFYEPSQPGYGPPHAASDGVYLEGLAAAYRLAVAVDDDTRADRYRVVINRALRNVMQLQFAGDEDLFYVSRPHHVLGGVRTTPYNNEIRVDNVQHNLMGVLDAGAALWPPTTQPGDR